MLPFFQWLRSVMEKLILLMNSYKMTNVTKSKKLIELFPRCKSCPRVWIWLIAWFLRPCFYGDTPGVIILNKAFCRCMEFRISPLVVALASSVFHRFLYLVFKEFKVVWRTPVVLWPLADVGNLVHFLLRHVHVPDINMDLSSIPSGFENIVMKPWQWIPPPPMTPPRLLRWAWHLGWLIMMAYFCREFSESCLTPSS